MNLFLVQRYNAKRRLANCFNESALFFNKTRIYV